MSETMTKAEPGGVTGDGDAREHRVLVLAPFGRDAAEVCRVLGKVGFDAEGCGSADQLCAEIARGAAAALVAEEALSTEARRGLTATLAEQPAWSDFPLLLMISQARGDDDTWHVLRGIEGTGHLTLLERPLHIPTLVSAVRTALKSRRRQYQVRDELAARRRAEHALQQREVQYRTLFESIDEGFCVIEVLFDRTGKAINYRFVEINPAFERQTGIENGVGRWMREIAPDHEDHWFEIYGRVTRTREPVRFQKPARALGRFYDVYAFPVGEPHQRRVAILFNDITDREETDARLRELNENLEARVAERAAIAERRARDLRRLAAELSEAEHRERRRLAKLLHDDLQQLLLAIKLRLPVLVEGPQDQIEQHVQRLDELIGECVNTSRNLTQELSPPVLQCGTLSEVIQWLGGWFADKYGLTVAVDTRGELPPLPDHLRVFLFQAVRELLFNVVKHSGKMEARIGLSSQDGYLRIQVEDDGDGFDPEAVEHRLQEPQGFGLFNIRERLEALLGRVEIQRTPQGGACFRLVVPMAEDSESLLEDTEPQQVKMATHPVRKSHPEDGALRLLVADDHAVVREGFGSLLERQPDFEVIGEAADGEEAIRQAEALRPDAIIMDVNMPNVGGVEATRRITERQPEIVIVGLSLHEDQSIARAMTEAGADAFVSKHAPAKDLIEAIRQACR